jgi:hypothetical protein
MPKKASSEHGVTVEIPLQQYEAMVETMIELAMRNAPTEAIVLRCAKAGGVKEVVKHITRMRVYAKKHRIPQRQASEGNGLPKPRGKKKSSKKRTPGVVDTPPMEREQDPADM